MVNTFQVAGAQDGLSLKAYRADNGVLLAFDLSQSLTPHLAGFALQCTPPNGAAYYVPNRLSFQQTNTNATTPEQRVWTPSDQAPFQKFRWVDFPPDIAPGTYTYTGIAMYFANGGLQPGPSVSVSLELIPAQPRFAQFTMGFTRGDLSSQAYADRFNNAPFSPTPRTMDYDTTPYEQQYAWLGFDARKLIFDFLRECLADQELTVDVFAYDLDEPDFIRGLQQLGNRLRILMDDAPLHTGPTALEPAVRALLATSAGPENVKTGHFQRFAHDKVMIQKRNGQPVKVLTGSANFSVRGLYVQANNVLVFDDPQTAALYEQAFQQSFTDMNGFKGAGIAKEWFDISTPGLPPFSVCFSPHASASVSLDTVASAIQNAKSSVLFAVMELAGGGDVLNDLKGLGARADIFSYGISQSDAGLTLFKPGATNGIFTSFDFLKTQVPAPFKAEWSGGVGQVIHHKFVVVDFNDTNPVVFTGSSNLAAGGEQANGDNLLAIPDRSVASAYAVEAIRLVDHYHFRAAVQAATTAQPLMLQPDEAQWWAPYYDMGDIKAHDRLLFSR